MKKTSNSSNNYEVIFVLPAPPIKYPAGGYDIVFRLAQALNEKSIKTAIVFLTTPQRYIPGFVQPVKLKQVGFLKRTLIRSLERMVKLFFRGKKFSYIYHHWGFISYHIFGSDYDYGILKKIDLFLYDTVNEIRFQTRAIVATAWQTAFFVKEYVKISHSKPLYLVQNSEDDFSFSGKNSAIARATYDFPFKKIVINQRLFNRFKLENPFFLHVGIDTNFFKIINEIKDRKSVIFPLRKGESKGSKYAIECIRKLLQNNSKIEIVAFGDYKSDELPNDIRDRVTYHFQPTRKVLLKLYNESMIFVLPSIVEGMSLPPLEAMASGCAAIVTDNGGVNEYIEDGSNGIMCPIKDSDCLYNKILLLINNNILREHLIQNGRETAKQFSYDNMNGEFVKLIVNSSLFT